MDYHWEVIGWSLVLYWVVIGAGKSMHLAGPCACHVAAHQLHNLITSQLPNTTYQLPGLAFHSQNTIMLVPLTGLRTVHMILPGCAPSPSVHGQAANILLDSIFA